MSAVYTQFPPPSAINVAQNAPLTDEQKALYDSVLAHFSADAYAIPDIEDGLLKEIEKFWLSHECICRYLRAVKWKSADAAIQRLEATLKWRRSFGIDDRVSAAHVEPEALTGKQIIFGYDAHGRPALYLIPSRQNTEESPRQIEFTVWMLERAIDVMAPGVESLALLINFADRGRNPSIATSRAVLNILQDHYPERLGSALIINIPFLINAFFKIIMPFVDPVTREKVHFNVDALKAGLFAPENIMQSHWGGSREFVYEHERYWRAFVEMTEGRREAWVREWRRLGGVVGVKEVDFKALTGPQSDKRMFSELSNAPVERPLKTDDATEEESTSEQLPN